MGQRRQKSNRDQYNRLALDQLMDIIFVQLPEIGDVFDTGEEFGFLESAQSVSDLYLPIAGRIIDVNTKLEDEPEIVNGGSFGKGWIIKI